MSEVLFEITKENLETGLRGYPCGYCTTSSVDPIKGVTYMGNPVNEIVDWGPEKIIYLLYTGKEGTETEIAQFKEDLKKRSTCNPELLKHIQKLPRTGHPMKLLCAAMLMAGMYESKNDYEEDALNLVAKMPEIVATVINYHAGWGATPAAKPELGYMENFAQMLNVPNRNLPQLTEALKLFNILHYDHGGGNLSTFVGKATASGLEEMYGSIVSALLALAGPRHGRANQDCLEFVQSVLKDLGENTTKEKVAELLRAKLDHHDLIFGFGHAVLRVEDPRAVVFYDYAKNHFPNHPLVKIATLLREVGPVVLKENSKIADPYPNVDAISGTVLAATGFPYPEYFTILFGLSRVVGISFQIVYERCQAREGKGTPIVRPKYLFKNRSELKS
jgi:citrate synthase